MRIRFLRSGCDSISVSTDDAVRSARFCDAATVDGYVRSKGLDLSWIVKVFDMVVDFRDTLYQCILGRKSQTKGRNRHFNLNQDLILSRIKVRIHMNQCVLIAVVIECAPSSLARDLCFIATSIHFERSFVSTKVRTSGLGGFFRHYEGLNGVRHEGSG